MLTTLLATAAIVVVLAAMIAGLALPMGGAR